MKTRWRRPLFGLVLFLAIVLALIFVISRVVIPTPSGTPPAAPQFVSNPPAIGHLMMLAISRTESTPDGKLWVLLANDVQFQTIYYRIDLHTGAIDYKGDPPLIFDPERGLALWSRVVTADPKRVIAGSWPLLNKLIWIAYPPGDPARISVEFWGVSGKGRAAELIGRVPAKPHADIAYWISPHGDYCRSLNIGVGQSMIDLKGARLIAMPDCDLAAREGGWWSDHEFAYFDRAGNIMLYDAQNGRTSPLVPSQALVEFAGREGLDYRPGELVHFQTARNGDQIAFILRGYPTGAGGGWLLSVDHASRSLRILARSFPPSRLGEFSADEKWFVYGGQTAQGDSNAVYVHDIATSRSTALIQPRASDYSFSQPRFINARIVYVQQTAIWSMNPDGSDQRRIFPPIAAAKK